MGVIDDRDRPDDSAARKHDKDSVQEEASALGQRVKGSIKKNVGDIADDRGMEEKGADENAAGRDRQRRNDGI